MSVWHGAYGPQGSNKHGMQRTTKVNGNKGIMKKFRQAKREEAEERNKNTPHERRRQHRVSLIRAGKLVPHSNSRDAGIKS